MANKNKENSYRFLLLFMTLIISIVSCGTDPALWPSTATEEIDRPTSLRSPSLQSKIIGGHLDVQSYPAVGALLQLNPLGGFSGSCSGTLIAPDVVLTARHCLEGHGSFFQQREETGDEQVHQPAHSVFVLDAQTFPLATAQMYAVRSATFAKPSDIDSLRRMWLPPLWNRPSINSNEEALKRTIERQCGSFEWIAHQQEFLACVASLPKELLRQLGVADERADYQDVALVFLEREVIGVNPMRLISNESAKEIFSMDSKHSRKALEVITVGYGWHELPPVKRSFTPKLLQRRFGHSFLVCSGEHMFQLDGGESTCHGDSGGPVLYLQDDGPYVIGISHGAPNTESCCQGRSIFMRVDSYKEWIESALQDACDRHERLSSACAPK